MSSRKKQRITRSHNTTTRNTTLTTESNDEVRKSLGTNITHGKTKKTEIRKRAKRMLNNEIDTRDPNAPLNFNFIQSLPDIAFSTEHNSSDEDNSNDPELYEKNDLTDWVRPKTELEIQEQNNIVQNGMANLVVRQNNYHQSVIARNNNKTLDEMNNIDDDQPENNGLGPRISQKDSSHTILSPDMLTRYGQGNSGLIYRLAEEHESQFTSIINHCYNSINGTPGYPKQLRDDTVLQFKKGFWTEDDEDSFLASEKCSFFYLMLRPIVGSLNHTMVDIIDDSIQQNGTTMIKRISMNNPKDTTNYFYEFNIFYIDTSSDDDIVSLNPFFLVLIFKYSNILVPTLNTKKKIHIDTHNQSKRDEEFSNCKTLINYVFFKIQ
jgi:hypothetical protein